MYMIDRCRIGVERALGCSFIKKPKISTGPLPTGKLGMIAGDEIVMRNGLLPWQAERTLCHELIHFAGIDDEVDCDRIEIIAWCNMPAKEVISAV